MKGSFRKAKAMVKNMKNNKLDCIGYIDGSLVEKAENYSVSRNKRPTRIKWTAAAACLCLIAAAIPLVLRFVSPSGNPSGQKEFVIENGVLLKYNGEGGSVVVPDNVTRIADTAFSGSDGITSLTIGKGTAEIGPAVFSALSELETVRVTPGNTTFISTGHVLVSKGGEQSFASVGAWKEEQFDYVVVRVINEMTENGIAAGNMKELTVGPARISVKAVMVEGTAYPEATAMTVYDKSVTFSEPIPLLLNGKFQAFEASDSFVISSSSYGVGKTYIIPKDGPCITEESPIPAASGEAYNDIIVGFFAENGQLRYAKQPRKYYIHQIQGSYMQYASSFEDVFEEEGVVLIENGTLRYQPEKVTLLREAIDVGSEFEDWKRSAGLPEDLTPEEWFQSNR